LDGPTNTDADWFFQEFGGGVVIADSRWASHLSFFDIHSTILFGGNANRIIATITIKNTANSRANAMLVA
jgi:hypothetical protein